jgi:hypothetical protein
MADTVTTYRIPAHKLESFKAVVERVSRKATKLGLDGITYRVLDEEPVAVLRTYSTNQWGDVKSASYLYVPPADVPKFVTRDPDGWHEVGATTLFEVEVSGQEPHLGGYSFVATIDHDNEHGNVVNTVPGQTAIDVADWVKAEPSCDHCHLVRNRIKTYVLLNTTSGNLVQLGSTCVADFFPGLAGEQIARLAELLVTVAIAGGDDSWGDGGESSKFSGWLRERVITEACASVRALGFVSKARAREAEESRTGSLVTTARSVEHGLTLRPGDKPFYDVTDVDVEKAHKVIEWVEALEPRTSDDYLWNLVSAVSRPVTSWKLLGLVVSAVSAYDREQQKIVEKLAERWIPVPDDGKRREIVGKVLSIRVDEGYYGASVVKGLLLVDTPDGTFKVWGTIPDILSYDVEVGDSIKITARLERSQDDQFFGFYKRPTKPELIKHG